MRGLLQRREDRTRADAVQRRARAPARARPRDRRPGPRDRPSGPAAGGHPRHGVPLLAVRAMRPVPPGRRDPLRPAGGVDGLHPSRRLPGAAGGSRRSARGDPEGIDPVQAAPMSCALGTAYRAVVGRGEVGRDNASRCRPGGRRDPRRPDRAPRGAGWWASTARADDRRRAELGIDARRSDDEEPSPDPGRTAPEGFDVVLDTVGHEPDAGPSPRLVRPGGRIVGVGYAPGRALGRDPEVRARGARVRGSRYAHATTSSERSDSWRPVRFARRGVDRVAHRRERRLARSKRPPRRPRGARRGGRRGRPHIPEGEDASDIVRTRLIMGAKAKTVPGRNTTAKMVAGMLRDQIQEGGLAPGTRLRQNEIAERFGVSTTPVREAFAQLQAEGLVRIDPHRGAVVSARPSRICSSTTRSARCSSRSPSRTRSNGSRRTRRRS